jgi:ACS family hexuronate transporter-like MFS transporter
MKAGAESKPPDSAVRRVAPGTWWICLLLLFATVLNYLDRQVLSLTADRIIAEYGLSREQFGELLAWFRYSYAAVQIGGGWLVDLLGPRLLYPAAVGLWSTAGILTAFTGSVAGLSACRFLLGIGEAFNWPCALKVTRPLLPPEDRPLANGIFNSGTALGAMLAPVIVTVLTLRFGWRSSFLFTGLLGVLWILVWQIYTRPRRAELGGERQPASRTSTVLLRLAKDRRFWLLTVSAVIVNSVSYFLADWIPLYLKAERGYSFAAGNLLSMLVFAGLDAGNLTAGVMVRAMSRRGVRIAKARRNTLLVSCVCMSCALGVGAASQFVTLASIIMTAVGVAGFLVIYLTLVQELVPDHVGLCAGLLGGLGNLAYGLVAPAIGRFSDMQQTTTAFVLISTLPWLAFAAIAAGRWEDK